MSRSEIAPRISAGSAATYSGRARIAALASQLAGSTKCAPALRIARISASAADAAAAAQVFRPDVYRSALAGTIAPLPGASSKVEGSLARATAVTAQQGAMVMENNSFFDGRSFDPDDIEGYLGSYILE